MGVEITCVRASMHEHILLNNICNERACESTSIYACMRVCADVRASMHVVYVCVCVYSCVCVWVSVHVHVCMCMCACACVVRDCDAVLTCLNCLIVLRIIM